MFLLYQFGSLFWFDCLHHVLVHLLKILLYLHWLLWSYFFDLDDPWFLPLHWGVFHVKQIVSLFFSLISILRSIFHWCFSQVKFEGIYFCCLLLCYRICYCVDLFPDQSESVIELQVWGEISHETKVKKLNTKMRRRPIKDSP